MMVAENEKLNPLYVVTSPQIHIITKMQFCHLKLQKCQYGLKMLTQ